MSEWFCMLLHKYVRSSDERTSSLERLILDAGVILLDAGIASALTRFHLKVIPRN